MPRVPMQPLRQPIEQLIESTNRFTIRRCLGAGGMGVVYEAYDRERDAVVALKTLLAVSPGSLYLFKQEFRALADVMHPNLVTLYELLAVDDQWFFTMERLEGTNVLAYLRGESPVALPDTNMGAINSATMTATAAPAQAVVGGTGETTDMPMSAPPLRDGPTSEPVPHEAIRPILIQLAEGLAALHSSGHLHCDLKPSNLLVTAQGRLVVLDYGVIVEMDADDTAPSSLRFRGTPSHTSPEQAGGHPPTPASDWYSVGVILYQALTGRRPFRGTATQVLELKQIADPPSLHEVCANADSVVAKLCMRLLSRDPASRPTGDDVLFELGYGADDSSAQSPTPAVRELGPAHSALIGRDRELASLRAAFDEARRGCGLSVRVKGRSGMGKTAVVTRFLDELRDDAHTLVLTGRCYERESVPHQAVDGLVDSLCQYLLQLPTRDARLLMPIDVPAMARAFPVLEQVQAVASARRRSATTTTDPLELRRRAYSAVKELFTRIAERQPLVLFIDDLQWGDVDSAPFLADLLHSPAPPLLLIVTYRSEEVESSALLQALIGPNSDQESSFAQAREIAMNRLSLPLAKKLATALLDTEGVPSGSAERIARESGGNPFFVHELVRYVSSRAGELAEQVPPLAQVLVSRALACSHDARQLLEVVAVAGKPLPNPVARRAAGIGDQHLRAIAELRTAHLIRTTGVDSNLVLETYHDRIRESFADSLSEDVLRAVHLRLAESIRAAELNDPEALAMHYAGGGNRHAASEFAAVAADKAADALAFDRAATFYRLALELTAMDQHEHAASLGRCLGDALANTGRGAESAEAYLAAANAADATADTTTALELRGSASFQFLRSGHINEGARQLDLALEAVGLSMASSQRRALLSVVFGRAKIRLRGLGFQQRDPAEIDPEELTRVDVCWSAAAGFAIVDSFQGAAMGHRYLLLALRCGEPARVARALSIEAAYSTMVGAQGRRRFEHIKGAAAPLVEQLSRSEVSAWFEACCGFAEYQCGKFREARALTEPAIQVFRDSCTGVAWEQATAELTLLWVLYYLGEMRLMCKRVRSGLEQARERGDLYTEANLSTGLPSVAWLCADEPHKARAAAQSAMEKWSRQAYHMQHYWGLFALAQCDLYVGDGIAARGRIAQGWPALRKAQLLRIQSVRIEALHLQARTELAAATAAGQTRAASATATARAARRIARRIKREDVPWGDALAELVLAGVASILGDRVASTLHVRAAHAGFCAEGMQLYAAVALHRLGGLLEGEDGRQYRTEADTWLVEQGIKNPQRIVAMFAPGFVVAVGDVAEST